MALIHARQALTANGWQSDVLVALRDDGTIDAVTADTPAQGHRVGILLPAPGNLHSHAFQRAMAGMTEQRGPQGRDSFWTWRRLMYRFLDRLDPDAIEAIAAFVQMEMLEAGYASIGEFHYLHHAPGGQTYANIAELSERIAAAASQSGIGLTLLPVLYEQGGCDGRPLEGGQLRFANTPERFARLHEAASVAIAGLPGDAVIGVAPHSLRAVSADSLSVAASLAPEAPLHMHIAEQTAEIEEVSNAYGRRPVEWLLDQHCVDRRWCLIHCTHLEPHETTALAKSGAVAGLCPITEANLGDGIFDGASFLAQGGLFGVGSDSNIRIALTEELRLLEYSQRLRDRARAVLAEQHRSAGRVLFDNAVSGGARALGRDAGGIEPGRIADLVALDGDATDLIGKSGDTILDAWIFAAGDAATCDLWSAGRHVVREGKHIARDAITARYRKALATLSEEI